MKRNVILLVDGDVDTYTATLTAAQTAGFDIRVAQIQRDLTEISDFELDDVAAIVVDYDPDVHGPAIAEELSQWLPQRPLIFISSEYEHALMFEGTAARHLTKPVSAARIVHALDSILDQHPAASCDYWGHPLQWPEKLCEAR
jgi:DNA-binding response OmpR family regulator